MSIRKALLIIVGVGVIGFLLAQAIPYGRSHSNPAVTAEPQWDTAETRVLFMKACGDCHSNETTWPWYSNIAPVSWLVQRDVDNGRNRLNVSEWDTARRPRRNVAERVTSGSMPPSYYAWLHPSARLSSAEKDQLAAGLTATFAATPAASPTATGQ